MLINQDKARPLTDTAEVYCHKGILKIGYTDKKISVVETYDNPTDFDNHIISLSALKTIKEWQEMYWKGGDIVLKGKIGEYRIPTMKYRQIPILMPPIHGSKKTTALNLGHVYKRHKNFFTDELNAFLVTDDYIVTTDSDTICVTHNNFLPRGLYDVDFFRILTELKSEVLWTRLDSGEMFTKDSTRIFIKRVNLSLPEHLILPLLTKPKKYDMIIPAKDFKALLRNFAKDENIIFANNMISSENGFIEVPANFDYKGTCEVKVLNRILGRLKGDCGIRVDETRITVADEFGFYILGGTQTC